MYVRISRYLLRSYDIIKNLATDCGAKLTVHIFEILSYVAGDIAI